MQFLSSGIDSCVFLWTSGNGSKVVRVSKKSDWKELYHETRISTLLRKVDPLQQRFVSSTYYERVPLSFLISKFGQLVFDQFIEALGKCSDIVTSSSALTTKILLSYMIPLKPLEGPLSKKQQDYLKDSIKVLHNVGIVHNDIHPKNIMLHDNVPVLIDWGHSIIFDGALTSDIYKLHSMDSMGYVETVEWNPLHKDLNDLDRTVLDLLSMQQKSNRKKSMSRLHEE